jgi:hypothetical protein
MTIYNAFLHFILPDILIHNFLMYTIQPTYLPFEVNETLIDQGKKGDSQCPILTLLGQQSFLSPLSHMPPERITSE